MSEFPPLSRILFWNVNNRDLTNAVCFLASSTIADVVVLNENPVPGADTLRALQENVSGDFYIPKPAIEERFHCFCRNLQLDLSEVHSGIRNSVRRFKLGKHEALLALVHGLDFRNYDSAARDSFAQRLAQDMRFAIADKKINKLILLGDFNMNPYDSGMNLAAGLNAMMTRSCVDRKTRRHLGEDYDFYYNPMWSLFGDNTKGPAGTVYDTSNQGPYGWSMIDQVLLHHSVVPLFRDVEILTSAEDRSLMTENGHPDAKNFSDHFPILVTFCGGEYE